MKRPERSADSSLYAWRLLATIAVTLVGITLLLFLFKITPNVLSALGLALVLAPLVRVVGDALNPDVTNPASLAGYVRRYLLVLAVLVLYLSVLVLVAPALVLALGMLGGILLTIVVGVGLILWTLQHWFGIDAGRALSVQEGHEMLVAFGAALFGTLACLGLLTLGMWIKDRMEARFWRIVYAVLDALEDASKDKEEARED